MYLFCAEAGGLPSISKNKMTYILGQTPFAHLIKFIEQKYEDLYYHTNTP
jgi:hypothetical protein